MCLRTRPGLRPAMNGPGPKPGAENRPWRRRDRRRLVRAGQVSEVVLAGIGERRLGEFFEEGVRFPVEDAIPLLDSGAASTVGRCGHQLVASLTNPETTSPERHRPNHASRIRHWGRTALAIRHVPVMSSVPKPTRLRRGSRHFAPREPDQRRTQASGRHPRKPLHATRSTRAPPDLAIPAAKGERHGKAYGGCRSQIFGGAPAPPPTRGRNGRAHGSGAAPRGPSTTG